MSQPQHQNPEIEHHRHAGSVARREFRRASKALSIVREQGFGDFPNLTRRLSVQRNQFRHLARHHYGVVEQMERSAA